jgi:tRNA dimethylallyltransferase
MINWKNKRLITIVGPTAVGKTAAAITVARHFGTEIISADSRQIFRELTIGTAKPGAEELAAVKHHFIDSHSIREPYDAAEYGKEARELVYRLFEQHDQLVLCGGSGLYIKAVTEGFDDIPEVPAEIRQELIDNYEKHGIGWLQEKMQHHDPEHYTQIDQQNPHRLMRALEVKLATGVSITSFRKNSKLEHPFRIVKIGLELPREELYRRIDERMDQMIEAGLFEEARRLYPYRHHNALQTVGYQEIFDHMDDLYDREEAIRLLKRNSRRYAKRQLTWFKKDPEIIWLNPLNIEEIIKIASDGTL